MLNIQLRKNIRALDLEIGKLNEEIKALQKDNKYEVKMKRLNDFVELRGKLEKTQGSKPSQAIELLDKEINELTAVLSKMQIDLDFDSKMKKLDELTRVRTQLSEAKTNESHTSAIITGAVGLAAILLVLKYEETDIITSKAFSIATKMFRGI